MKKLSGEIKVVGYYPSSESPLLYIVPSDKEWEQKKGYEAIAFCYQGVLHFRKLYYARGGCYFRFKRNIYLSQIERTEGTHSYIYV